MYFTHYTHVCVFCAATHSHTCVSPHAKSVCSPERTHTCVPLTHTRVSPPANVCPHTKMYDLTNDRVDQDKSVCHRTHMCIIARTHVPTYSWCAHMNVATHKCANAHMCLRTQGHEPTHVRPVSPHICLLPYTSVSPHICLSAHMCVSCKHLRGLCDIT